jgi:RNA polymerase sigma-70 factor (ECF subfamily)
VPERDWATLVHSIAAGDQLALHALYEMAHRIVFTLIMRITADRETAGELTIDVFRDIWRRASRYDAATGTVRGWIMNQARSRPSIGCAVRAERNAVRAATSGAVLLNQPLGTIKTRIRSGLHKLRQWRCCICRENST